MDIIGRSYMLIASGNKGLKHTGEIHVVPSTDA